MITEFLPKPINIFIPIWQIMNSRMAALARVLIRSLRGARVTLIRVSAKFVL